MNPVLLEAIFLNLAAARLLLLLRLVSTTSVEMVVDSILLQSLSRSLSLTAFLRKNITDFSISKTETHCFASLSLFYAKPILVEPPSLQAIVLDQIFTFHFGQVRIRRA